MSVGCYNKPVDVSAMGHCNAAMVIECHHADHDVYVKVGGNYGRIKTKRSQRSVVGFDTMHILLYGGLMIEDFWKLDDELWLTLTLEGKFDLISKLQKAFNKEPGFGTVAISREGFSENDRTHNLVVRGLKRHNVHILDVMYEIGNLELAASSFYKVEED